MKISFDVYNVFYYVSKFESITQAANYLYVSQPAITRQIKNLEMHLGVTLFHRTKNGLKLTEEGKQLYNEIKEGIELFNLIESKYNDKKEPEEGEITVISGYATTKNIILPKLVEFNKKYPKIKVKLLYYPFQEAIRKLQLGEVDLLLLNIEDVNLYSDLIIKPFYELHDILVVNASQRERYPEIINIKDINNYPIICKESHNSAKNFITNILDQYDMQFQPTWELTDYWLIEEYIKMNMGIGIVSYEFVKKEIKEKLLCRIKTDIDLPNRSIGYAIRKNSILSPVLTKFIKWLSDN